MKSAFVAAILALFCVVGANALTIDTNSTYSGYSNYGMYGSGQTLTVDAVENHLDDISFYFDAQSAGWTFTFTLSDALTGGNTLFSTNFIVASGINTFLTDIDLAPSSVVYAVFNYNGFTGSTANFSDINGYSGGNSLFLSQKWYSFASMDHRFVANFSAPTASPVPLPAALPLLLAGLGGFALLGRRKRA